MGTRLLIFGVLTLASLAVSSATRPATVPARTGNFYPSEGMIDALLKRRLPAVRLREVSLEQAMEQLRSASGANLFVDWHALKAANIDRSSTVDVDLQDVSLAQALDYTLRSTTRDTNTELVWDVQDNVIVISTVASALQIGSVRIYDVRDLMETEFARQKARWDSWVKEHGSSKLDPRRALVSGEPTWEELANFIEKVIEDNVAPDTWKDNGGVVGSIRELNGRLVVQQTWQNHQKIEAILDELREKGLPATRPSVPAATQSEGGPL